MDQITLLKTHNLEIAEIVKSKYKKIDSFLTTEVNKTLREMLQLEDNTDITRLHFSPYSRTDKGITIRFGVSIVSIDSEDNKKYLFGHGMDVAYTWSPIEGSSIEMNHGSMGSFSDNDTSRIDNVKNLYKVSQNLTNIKLYLDTLDNVKITAQEIRELQNIARTNENRILALEAELKAHMRDAFVEDNKDKEISVDFPIVSRTYKKEVPNKIKVLKKLPKGDYKVELVYDTYYKQTHTIYISMYELDRIINKLNKKKDEEGVK